MLIAKKRGKSKGLSRGFCVRDAEAAQRALQLLHIYCSIANSYSLAPESNKTKSARQNFRFLPHLLL